MLVAKKSQPSELSRLAAAEQAQASSQLRTTGAYGSAQRAAFATRHVSVPLREVVRQRAASVRPQVEFDKARSTSLRHAAGKPSSPSSFACAFTTGRQHFPNVRELAADAHGHSAATAARTSATTPASEHLEG